MYNIKIKRDENRRNQFTEGMKRDEGRIEKKRN